jgi:hypothetical protein
MKIILVLLILILQVSSPAEAQGNGKAKSNSKSKDKSKDKVSNAKNDNDKNSQKHEVTIWEGTHDKDGGGPKPSKNQPAKVRSAFQRDYPYATNVRWSKYRGDWTATFGNGFAWSTAVYHANGQRKDTRSLIGLPQLPPILEGIFKKRPGVQLSDIIKIEVPNVISNIFRVKSINDGTSRFLFYNAEGQEVTYDY